MANTNIKLTGLDFDSLKANFKDYLKRSDSPFKDVDYDGSNINQLLDIFAYNTYINSFYLNMVASEMFLDSATLRDSVLSHAKELNYVPRSYKSAEAVVSFSVTPSTPLDSLLLPKGSSFTTKVGSNTFTFSTQENIVLTSNANGVFNADELKIYEGAYVVDSFVYNNPNENQRFVLSNPTVDTRSLTVIVIENEGANNLTYTRATSFLGHQSNSQIYFIQAAENGQYEILFGDNIIGRRPQNGATIAVEYRVSNGELPNGASTFFIDGPIQGQSNVSTVITQQTARGGGISESLESIKYNAPRAYQNQERAVTTTDYENLLRSNFPEIQAVSAFGGEEAEPPQYGRVFISVDVTQGDGVPDVDKARFLEFIKPRAAVGLTPVFIDPEFLYLDVTTVVRYNSNATDLNPSAIETLVRNEISLYNEEFLNDFKRTIRCSKLAERINNIHPSVLGIDLGVYPNKRIVPTIGQKISTVVEFGFAIDTDISLATTSESYIKSPIKGVYSSRFVYNGLPSTLQDDRAGNLNVYSNVTGGDEFIAASVGTVDYEKGVVRIEGLIVDSFEGNGIHIHVYPVSKDIPATKNTIIKIDEADTEVTAVAEKV